LVLVVSLLQVFLEGGRLLFSPLDKLGTGPLDKPLDGLGTGPLDRLGTKPLDRPLDGLGTELGTGLKVCRDRLDGTSCGRIGTRVLIWVHSPPFQKGKR
jgi:hypothetical protein